MIPLADIDFVTGSSLEFPEDVSNLLMVIVFHADLCRMKRRVCGKSSRIMFKMTMRTKHEVAAVQHFNSLRKRFRRGVWWLLIQNKPEFSTKKKKDLPFSFQFTKTPYGILSRVWNIHPMIPVCDI
jgi:hypothetical protein